MEKKREDQQNPFLPRSLESIRNTGSAIVGLFTNDQTYFLESRREFIRQKQYEENLEEDLRSRIITREDYEEIKASMQKHPSHHGYL